MRIGGRGLATGGRVGGEQWPIVEGTSCLVNETKLGKDSRRTHNLVTEKLTSHSSCYL
jgi:hypothetical protein